MNTRPFPKPVPEDPLPLDIWLNQTDRAEVGRESFFRGRDSEFDIFRTAAMSLDAGRIGGNTMIFQGAPGAGKTALMAECMEAVRRHSKPEAPWVAVNMPFANLASASAVMSAIARSVRSETERLRNAHGGRIEAFFQGLTEQARNLFGVLMERGVSAFGVSIGATSEIQNVAPEVFQRAAPLLEKYRIVVCVDEAQNTPVRCSTQAAIDCLHRDSQGIPLVALFFGLSNTRNVLRQCGLSRFAHGRVANIERLSIDDASSSIRSMFDAYDFTGAPEDRKMWVESLAELSRGWPQHINRVGVSAARVISANGARIEKRMLTQAVETGLKSMEDYYAERLEAGSNRAWVYKQLASSAKEAGGALSYDEIAQLTGNAREQMDQTMDKFLNNALRAGLLAPVREIPDHYRIPIPSFSDYLQDLPVEPPSIA